MVRIDDIISYIPACDEPLSADVGVITGNKKTWIFDVGSSESTLEEIHQIDCEKAMGGRDEINSAGCKNVLLQMQK